MRKKILFLIHDLGQGGAEKVLVNLVNNMDPEAFDIHVTALFGGGINEKFLKPHIHYRSIYPSAFPGNSHVMKLFSPKLLHKLYVKEHYDIEVAYLEGPCARIIGGCSDRSTQKVCWIHIELPTPERAAVGFRSHAEALRIYRTFDRIVCVSQAVREVFLNNMPVETPVDVLYNTNESTKIRVAAQEPVDKELLDPQEINLVCVGKLLKNKGFHRLIPIVQKLHGAGHAVHLYILGTGPMEAELKQQAEELGVSNAVTFLGYQTNPYKYVAKCDLFVCSSFAEGFSTAATEALIVGTPVCTVEVSGMKEMLGEHNEWGLVTENSDDALYEGIKSLLDDPALLAHYRAQAQVRSSIFSTEKTVCAVQDMFLAKG